MSERLKGLPLLFLIALTLFVYAPLTSYDFLRYDDEGYVTANAQVLAGLTGRGLIWAFQDGTVGHWHPLTWISHMLDAQIYGLNPGGHHLTNLLLHLLNTGLLFVVLRQLTGLAWESFLVAALFALHPLSVESVAWVAERKNVLSTFFWIATMGAYGYYVRSPGFFRYAGVFLLFALGLMAKPMLVTLPFVLLLLDYWPLKRWHLQPAARQLQLTNHKSQALWLVLEKLPLFLLTVLSMAFTLWAARVGGATAGGETIPLALRLANILVSYGTYLVKMVWPAQLAVFYPYPEEIALWKVGAAAALLIGMSACAVYWARRFPYLFVGWFWYLGTLVPVIGLVQVGAQAMADRYAYVPLLGIFMVIAWGSAALAGSGRKGKAILVVSTLAVLTAFTVRTSFQVQYWQNGRALFTRAVAVTEGNYLAHYHLGVALLDAGKGGEALTHFRKAAVLKPNYEPAYNYLGVVLHRAGRQEEALPYYRQAISIKPDFGDAYYNLGTLFFSLGRLEEALAAYRQAVLLLPRSAPLYNNLAVALIKSGDERSAIAALRKALELKPDYAGAHLNLAWVLQKKGLLREAETHRAEAKRLNSPEEGR